MSQNNEQVMHQALDALTDVTENCEEPFKTREAIKALNEALAAQAGQLHQYEEVAEHYAKCAISPEALRDWVVTAQARQSEPAPVRQPLTPEQIDAAYRLVWSTVPHDQRLTAFAHAIYGVTAPVRQPLTDADIDELFTSIRAELCAIGGGDEQIPQFRRCIARALEAKINKEAKS